MLKIEDGGWAVSQKGKRITCTGTTLVFLFLKLAAAQELCKEKKVPNKLLISWLVSLPYGPQNLTSFVDKKTVLVNDKCHNLYKTDSILSKKW